MLKRTQGRLLLTLLVITGLAGTLNNTSLSGKERKFAIFLMKDTKTDVFKSIKDLSEKQLNFKAAPDHWSIKECAYRIAISEKDLWNILETTMKAPANPEKRALITMTDEQVVKMIEDGNTTESTSKIFEFKTSPYKSLNEALESFKTNRSEHIKYLKSTTEDLRDHVVQMPFGWLDCYQLCLMIASKSNWYKLKIDEAKAAPDFPKH